MTTQLASDRAADGFYVRRTPGYLMLYPVLCDVARVHGYALAMHGSLVRDLDVVAVPWVEKCSPPIVLVQAIAHASGGQLVGSVARRPHGRLVWTVQLGVAGFVDLSVMTSVDQAGGAHELA